jgi:hypothetical protein
MLPVTHHNLPQRAQLWHLFYKARIMKKGNDHNKYKLADFLFVLLAWLMAISLVYLLIIKLQYHA